MKLQSRLRRCRKNKGISSEEAAKLLGISRKTLSSYENGKTVPTTSILIMMLEVYNATIEDLTGLHEEPDQFAEAGKLYESFKEQAHNDVCRMVEKRIRAGASSYTDEHIEFMFVSLLKELVYHSPNEQYRQEVIDSFNSEYGHLTLAQE